MRGVETYRLRTGEWANRLYGPNGQQTYTTRTEAVAEGQAVARLLGHGEPSVGAEHFVRTTKGWWSKLKNTYPRSRDPRTSKG
jgi:hypothetical protein